MLVCSIGKSNLKTCNFDNVTATNTGSVFKQRYVVMKVLHILISQRQFTISSNEEQNDVSTFQIYDQQSYSVYYKGLTKHFSMKR